ncbi:armadillo-type protein, partial [Pilobolus umbonatus]
QIMEVILSGCKSIHQDELARSFCRFMYKVFTGQIRTTSLRTSHFEICLNYLLDCLRTENNEYKVDILRTMSVLIYENSVNLQKSASRLVGNLLTLADKSVRPLEVRRMAINCIGNMISGSGSKFQSYTQDLYECLLSNICTVNRTSQGTFMAASNSLDFADPAIRKIASSTLRSLQFFLTQDKTLITNPLCDIVEIIHTYIFINVSVKSYSAVLPTSSNSVRRNKILQSNRASFPWRSSIHTNSSSIKHMSAATSSESELSDSSALSNDISPRRQREYSKIRINALLCLSAIALTTPKALYPRWHRFIPDTFSLFMSNNSSESHHLLPLLQSDNQPLSLFTLLLYDPSPNVRIAVCNTLISLLTGSKKYLSLAMER